MTDSIFLRCLLLKSSAVSQWGGVTPIDSTLRTSLCLSVTQSPLVDSLRHTRHQRPFLHVYSFDLNK